MSVLLKIGVPVAIIAALVWLYTTQYPNLVNKPSPQPVETVEVQVPKSTADITTNEQIQADLGEVDAIIKQANEDVTEADAALSDTPVAQTE